MKNKNNENNENRYVCDFCGHFWSKLSTKIKRCGICGEGTKIKINSEYDFRRDIRYPCPNVK